MGERIMKTPESDIPLANAAAAISFVEARVGNPRTSHNGNARRFRSEARRCERAASIYRGAVIVLLPRTDAAGVAERTNLAMQVQDLYDASRVLHNAANRADASAHSH
jgi:hypothetical protein